MWIIGYFYEQYGPLYFLYIIQAYGILLCVLAFILHFSTWGKGHRFKDEMKKEEVVEVNNIQLNFYKKSDQEKEQ